MNTRAEVFQAVEDFHAGKLGVIPATGPIPHAAPGDVVQSTDYTD